MAGILVGGGALDRGGRHSWLADPTLTPLSGATFRVQVAAA